MTVLTQDERMAVSNRLLSAGSDNLALIFSVATGEDASWTLNRAPPVVVTLLMDRLARDATVTIAVCDALVNTFPTHSRNEALTAIADRLRAQKAQAAADPMQELWIGSEPMVNRGKLRQLLTEIHMGYYHGVIYVAGGPMSGRSHTFQLLRHVARNLGIRLHLVDFALETEARTLQHLYRSLREALEIDADVEPTHEGATPGDVAGKYASHFGRHLAAAPLVNPKPWLVIDFSDEVPDPAVPEFIRMICAYRDANRFDNCVIFVLGPTAHLDSMRGELLNMQEEDLGAVVQTEIFDAAATLNQRGSLQLDDVALNARAAKIYDDVTQLPGNAQFPALRRALLELRREVRAP